jgi:chemosensory pili system protein ChpA (sensor histidine kinase/response regulator)
LEAAGPGAVPKPQAPAVAPARAPAAAQPVDWQRFVDAQPAAGDAQPGALQGLGAAGSVRVRTPLLDRLVNQAGEVSISRSRIESDVAQIKGALGDLTDNLERLRAQLRDIELQAETQIDTRMEAARAASQAFDPLEMDRFTRFQELTRMMAESVADVATVQRGMQRTLQSTEDSLAHQARMTRDMQDDLLRTRMVEFEGLSERLYRVVRQAAKETGKPVRLDIVGGSIEIDRGVLDRMTAAFEHLLRNSVVHGIESAEARAKAGKDATGTITLSVTQVGNEVGVEVRDDGAGLNLPRIRERGLAMGLIAPGAEPDDAALANLVFQPGFTTATSLTGLAGRGVGMDVVRTDVNAMGGRIETASAPGQGTSFRLVLPLTTAVTQVVMLRCGERAFAVPSTLIEIVRRVKLPELARAYETQTFAEGGQALPFFWLDGLLGGSARGHAAGRTATVVVIHSAAQRVVLHVDEVLGNQEVVVKNLGPQLSRVPGLVGMTLLPSGLPALIYNPVALATLYGDEARQALAASAAQAGAPDAGAGPLVPLAPLVLVVDDSLTVRRITQRLLEREGYRVTVAKDGLDGLDKLAIEVPAVLLTDIEMPRMDGFDLVRNLRADARLAHLPVVMITSRIAQKHRDYAAELGVDHYLGKPYAEDELLGLVARYARRVLAAA